MSLALVALGGAVGAPLRFFIARVVQGRRARDFPWGTLTVNVAGCLVYGILAGAGIGGQVLALVGVGFCGALTTFSTFGYETYQLIERRSLILAGVNVALSLTATMLAVGGGFLIGTWVG